MAIPRLNLDGCLPVGVHLCTLAELKKRFGSFARSDNRVRLFARLEVFVEELLETGLVRAIVVDGSFVTNNPSPGDIDLIVALYQAMHFTLEILPRDYNALSRKRVRARFGFDVFVDVDKSAAYKEHVAFFKQLRNTKTRKGMLRIEL